ncbi:hypothetical protein [Niveibacterium umoris]|uniref:Uncharacterized protein n=1 Tax=Niveibacterium umoris TaxID=1193620 RepID=A0A840BRN2_9RHOO|nr:hypothetical protein [Niveibacterium umoris]MBB4013057.1 hypothetical protein [Niveibacterium umoris]
MRATAGVIALLGSGLVCAAPTPPGAEIIVMLGLGGIVFAIAVVLAFIAFLGYVAGGSTGAERALKVSVAALGVFALGAFCIAKYQDLRRSHQLSEYRAALRSQCMTDVIERGTSAALPVDRVYVLRSQRHQSGWPTESFSFNGASSIVAFVGEEPKHLAPNEALIEMDVQDRAAVSGSAYSMLSVETRVSTGRQGLIAARTSLLNCVPEDQEVAVERFARRALVFEGSLLRAVSDPSALAPTEYPIARFAGDLERGRFEIANDFLLIHGDGAWWLPPPAWACERTPILGSNGRDAFNCRRESGEVLRDDGLTRAYGLKRAGNGWLVIQAPLLENGGSGVEVSTVVVQQRSDTGRVVRTWNVRIPTFPGQQKSRAPIIGDLRLVDANIEIVWLTEQLSDPNTFKLTRWYTRKSVLTFPYSQEWKPL